MPCTLHRREVWLVSYQNCPNCSKLLLPRSVKLQLHQACNSLANARLQLHEVCIRTQANLPSAQVTPNPSAEQVTRKTSLARKTTKTGWSTIAERLSSTTSNNDKRQDKKFKMEDDVARGEETDTDSDSDSVIILTDEDDKPISQRLVAYREVSKKIDDDAGLIKHDIKDDGDELFAVSCGSIKESEEPIKIGSSTCTMGVEVSENSRRKTSCLKTNGLEGVKKEEAGDQTDSEEDEMFEKHCKQDMNFVVAKFMVKKKIGIQVFDPILNLTPFEKKLRKILDQADILKIKKSLDDGGKIFTPKDMNLKKLLPKPIPPPTPIQVVGIPTFTLSDEGSPNTTQTLPVKHAYVTQMPVVADDLPKDVANSRNPQKTDIESNTPFKFKPYCLPAPKPKKLSNSLKPKPLTPLKPPVVFRSIKTKSFKIPRAVKTKLPRWVTNGSLWQWALTVDEAGQYSRYSS